MSTVLNGEQTFVVPGLSTYTHTVVNAGLFNCSMVSSVVPPSSLSLTIAQTGSRSVSVSSVAPSSAQQIVSIQNLFNCASGDVLTFTISSSAPIDEQLNTIKTTIALGLVNN